MTDPDLPSGWFPDPLGRYDHRWFNGRSWTSDVSVNGQRFVDPLGNAPGPGATTDGAGSPGNRMATAAMICGLVGIAVAWIPFVVVGGIALGVLGIVFGVKGLGRSGELQRGRGPAITGIVTGGVALLVSIVGIVLSVVVVREVMDFIEPGPRFVDDVECIVDGRDVAVSGTITNLDDERHDYTIFVTVGGRTVFDVVDHVDPDEVANWSVSLRTSTAVETCRPGIVVNGPFPFGIETDPVEN